MASSERETESDPQTGDVPGAETSAAGSGSESPEEGAAAEADAEDAVVDHGKQ